MTHASNEKPLVVLGFAKLVREELAMNPHDDDEGHLRCTCDECCAALLAELWEKPLTIQPAMVIYTAGMNATTPSTICRDESPTGDLCTLPYGHAEFHTANGAGVWSPGSPKPKRVEADS